MMRDYRHIDLYLSQLSNDIYGQPPDEGHQEAIQDVINKWIAAQNFDTVLDVGCGQGQAMEPLSRVAKKVVGVTMGEDVVVCQSKGLDVHGADMTFLPFEDGEFNLVFARHTLEHSPMPLLTLMEWNRVSNHLLCLILPTYAHYGPSGHNHYYVLQPDQWKVLIDRAGWDIIWTDESRENEVPWEHRWMCQKKGI